MGDYRVEKLSIKILAFLASGEALIRLLLKLSSNVSSSLIDTRAFKFFVDYDRANVRSAGFN